MNELKRLPHDLHIATSVSVTALLVEQICHAKNVVCERKLPQFVRVAILNELVLYQEKQLILISKMTTINGHKIILKKLKRELSLIVNHDYTEEINEVLVYVGVE